MRRRLRRRPAPPKALTPKSTIWKAPGSDDSGALRLVLLPPGSIGFRLERRLSSWGPHGKRYSSSFLQGTRPRFASGTLMSLRTTPPFRAGVLCGCGRVFRVVALGPAAGACRCTFRKRHQGTLSGALRSEARRERSAREGGFPCRSVGRCAPAASLGKGRGTRTVTAPRL